MRTIRRLYLYAVSLVSLEVALWGLIGLLRTVIELGPACAFINLSLSLALLLVGAPLCALHWTLAERLVRGDEQERASRERAGFLYGLLLATLIPAVQNLLALLNRGLVRGALTPVCQPLLGGEQSWPDNLVAILLNLAAAGLVAVLLRRDLRLVQDARLLVETRRLFRFVWVVYGLGLTVYGLGRVLSLLLLLGAELVSPGASVMLVDGVVLILVGTPIWVYAWNTCQAACADPAEADSRLRRVLLYLLALVGIPSACVSLHGLLTGGLLAALGQQVGGWQGFLREHAQSLRAGLPLAVVSAYYGTWLRRDLVAMPGLVGRGEWRRPYLYLLSSAGLIVSVVAVLGLLQPAGFLLFLRSPLGVRSLAGPIARSLALLGTGLPLWLLPWVRLQAEVGGAGEAADHARRSLLRRIYLYLAAFAALVGAMVMAVNLLSNLLEPAFLNSDVSRRAFELFQQAACLAVYGVVLAYHLSWVRRDGLRRGEGLAARQARYPVLVLDPGEGDFGARMAGTLRQQAPYLPVTVLSSRAAPPAGQGPDFQAVLLPASLALDPPQALGRWLRKFPGTRIVVAEAVPGWVPGGLTVEQAARAAGQLSEGQEVRLHSPLQPLVVLLCVFLGLLSLLFLVSLFNSLSF